MYVLYLFDKYTYIIIFLKCANKKVDGRYHILFIVYVANEENIKQLSKTLTFS